MNELDESEKYEKARSGVFFFTLVLFDKKNFKENWDPMLKIMFPLKRKKSQGI
jgi:uncharacterized membrane protein